MPPGRNEPCPCGSGKKYKKCCLLNETGTTGEATGMLNEIHDLIEGQDFGSIEEVQTLVERHMHQRNRSAEDDFHGLSPDQMHGVLYSPFESPTLVEFPTCLDNKPTAPVVRLFELLADAIGDKGLKPTATGNLPRGFCREAALAFLGEEEYRKWSRFGELRSETEFHELHATRLVAEMAGLVRKYKGKFILSKECRTLLEKNGMAAIYPRLMKSFIAEYNWAYGDGYPEIGFFQSSFLFTLYLLNRYGDQQRSNAFYEDAFLQAFPRVLDELDPQVYRSPEEAFRSIYSRRCLERFAEFLGFAKIIVDPDDRFGSRFELIKRPLLGDAVRFR